MTWRAEIIRAKWETQKRTRRTVKITLNILRNMDQNQLPEELQNNFTEEQKSLEPAGNRKRKQEQKLLEPSGKRKREQESEAEAGPSSIMRETDAHTVDTESEAEAGPSSIMRETDAHTVDTEIQTNIRSPERPLSSFIFSLMAYLLMLEEVLDEFDLERYSDELGSHRYFLPVVIFCRKANLSRCELEDSDFEIVASVLKMPNSRLRELNLSGNCSHSDEGEKMLWEALLSQHCGLEILRLSDWIVTDESCGYLASVLRSNTSHLRELDLSWSNLQGSRLELICDALMDASCRVLKVNFSGCDLDDDCCKIVASVLQSPNSHLKELDMSHNESMGNRGVELLCGGLRSRNCVLNVLRLRECGVRRRGCRYLASALRVSTSHLRELDLSENDLGESEANIFSDRLDQIFRVECIETRFCVKRV